MLAKMVCPTESHPLSIPGYKKINESGLPFVIKTKQKALPISLTFLSKKTTHWSKTKNLRVCFLE